MQKLKIRFDKKWAENEKHCWIWTGAHGGSRSPRPQISYQGKIVYATRIAWILYKGSVPPKLNILHTCDEPSCVNPEHLFLGNQQVNMQDASRKGRLNKNVINEEVVAHIRGLRSLALSYQNISHISGIPLGTVGHILAGTRWSNV